ncbi:MAG: PQQ-binding-like beta-propeller repeat protein [Muribaculaceae bacterium]
MKKRFILSLALALMVCLGAIAQKIAVLSDIHVTPGNDNEQALRRAVEEINTQKFDLVVVCGDLSNEGSDAELANVDAILRGIKHSLFVLPGNHENNWSQSATKTFIDTFGNDRFVTEVDSLVIVGINCGPFMKMGDGHIKQEDLHWLRKTLTERVAPGKRVLSFNHYPIRKDDLDNWADYASILLDFPVIGHINGHYHSFRQYNIGDIPAAMVRALDMRDKKPGYSIVEVTPQWTHIYNKVIGQNAVPMLAFANNTRHNPLKADKSAEWTMPEGFEITKVWADSASVFTRLGFDADNVYFGTSLGNARAVNKNSGTLVWDVPTGASLFSRPVLTAPGRLAVPHATGIMIVDTKNGKVLKNWPSKQGPYVADGLLSADGKAYVQGGYKRFERRDPRSGKLVWSYDSLNNYAQAAPVIAGDEVIFGAWDTYLRSLSLKNGKLNWKWNNGKSANMLGPGNVVPVVTNDKVIIVAPDRFMTALDRKTGRQLWRDKSHRYREALGVSEDGSRAYAKTMDGELVAVDTSSPEFRELWTVDMGLGYEHAPCIVVEKDGVVYAGSRRGIVTAVDPVAQKVLWSIPVGVSETNGIDVDPTTGDIYVSLIEGTIFRIRKI